jgi:hypothetical protein
MLLTCRHIEPPASSIGAKIVPEDPLEDIQPLVFEPDRSAASATLIARIEIARKARTGNILKYDLLIILLIVH